MIHNTKIFVQRYNFLFKCDEAGGETKKLKFATLARVIKP